MQGSAHVRRVSSIGFALLALVLATTSPAMTETVVIPVDCGGPFLALSATGSPPDCNNADLVRPGILGGSIP